MRTESNTVSLSNSLFLNILEHTSMRHEILKVQVICAPARLIISRFSIPKRVQTLTMSD